MSNLDKETLLTVTESGSPAKRRISSVAAARVVVGKLVDSMAVESMRRARLKGQINGNPPHDPTRHSELGLGYTTNINFLELRAVLDQRASLRFETYFETPTLITVKPSVEQDSSEVVMDYGAVIAEEFSKTVKDWTGFFPLMDKVGRESDAYGVGVALFPDEWDWRPKAYSTSCFFPDPNAEMDIDRLQVFALRDKVSAGELWRSIENEEIAKKEGWNIAAVKKLLVEIYVNDVKQSDEQYMASLWEDLQQKLRNNDTFVQTKEFDPVHIYHLFTQEVDTGEVSYMIFSVLDKGVSGDAFLYEASRKYKKMSQALWWLLFNFGDGYLRSCRGIASYLEAHCDLSNRFFGQALDAGQTSATLLVQPKTGLTSDRLQITRSGILTVVDPNLTIQQSSFQPPIQPLIQLRSISNEIMRNNTNIYRQFPEVFMENQPAKTAREVAEIAGKEARAEKAELAFQLDYVQRLYREMFTRMLRKEYLFSEFNRAGREDALDFVRRCVMRGVPLELLVSPVWEVRIVKPIGGGSWGVRMDIASKIMSIRGDLDETGRLNAVRDYIAVMAGYENVDRYKALVNRDKIPSNEHSLATLETNDFAEGVSVPVGSDQTHVIHFSVHAQYVIGLIQAFQESQGQGMDLEAAVKLLGMAIPHMAAHLKYLSMDPTREAFVQEGMKLLQVASALYEQVKKLMEQQAAAMQKMQQDQQKRLGDADQIVKDRELEAKIYEINRKYQVEVLKQESLNGMRAEKTAQQMDIRRGQVSEDMRLKAERQLAELEMESARVQADIELKRAKQQEAE